MYLTYLFVITGCFCCFLSSNAWLAPERCRQEKRSRANGANNYTVFNLPTTETTIEEIVSAHHNLLLDIFKGYNFYTVPIKGQFIDRYNYTMYGPTECKFRTEKPSAIISVYCGGDVACELNELVSTVDQYTASEGYNWGVKIGLKFSFGTKFPIFEMGGEASVEGSGGGSYGCTYTKGRTKQQVVKCSVKEPAGSGTLRLYDVKSDMECKMGTIKLIQDVRHEVEFETFCDLSWFHASDNLEVIQQNSIFEIRSGESLVGYMIDLDKVPMVFLRTLVRVCPLYNPYTDLIMIENSKISLIRYYKADSFTPDYAHIVPFTNKEGNAVTQYACVFTK